MPATRQDFIAELARRELARRSFPEYLAYTQGRTWKRTRLSEYLATQVQEFVEADTGHAFDILVVQCPPQHGKSITISETFPSWYLGKYPERRIILAAYNDEFAEKFLRRNTEKVKTVGKNIFGIEPGKVDRAAEFELSNSKGRIIARGLKSGITGNPGDLVIIDDPIKNREEAYSPAFRAKVWGEWVNSVKTRLSAGAKIIVIATPWHCDDIMARIIARESNVRVIRLPVSAGENDPLGRAPGEALCPELGKDNKWLADFEPAYLNDPEGGRAAWNAMFLCSPIIDGGNIVQREWFKFYDPKDISEWGTTIISVDAAFKGGENNDFVAITVWSKLGTDYYLRHLSNKKLDFPQTLTELRMVKAMFPEAFTVLVEDKANGSAIIATLRHEMPGVVGVNPRGGKEARVNAVSGVIESGHVHIPKDAHWQDVYLDQWAAFPAGKHDDMVDSSTQALSYMLYSSGDPLYAARPVSIEEELAQQEQEAFLDGDRCYDVYGQNSLF